MTAPIRYLQTYTITGGLRLLTGLRIGAGRDTVEIGGLDNPVIKHPHTQQPYIPGSSIKGKLRSLLEWATNSIEATGKVWGTNSRRTYDPADAVLRIFGATHEKWAGGPGRVIVRDAHLNQAWLEETLGNGFPLTEEKAEVVIDRIQGKAAGTGPRRMERVPANAVFDLQILFKCYATNGDGGARDRQCLELLLKSLKLLEQDALGGSGSRGYGRVEVLKLMLDGSDIQPVFESIRHFDHEGPALFLGQ